MRCPRALKHIVQALHQCKRTRPFLFCSSDVTRQERKEGRKEETKLRILRESKDQKCLLLLELTIKSMEVNINMNNVAN
jgi:hypothetical protein